MVLSEAPDNRKVRCTEITLDEDVHHLCLLSSIHRESLPNKSDLYIIQHYYSVSVTVQSLTILFLFLTSAKNMEQSVE